MYYNELYFSIELECLLFIYSEYIKIIYRTFKKVILKE